MNDVIKRKWKMTGGILILIIFILIIASGTIVNFITDYQWFNKNEIINTFLVKILTQIGIILPIWILTSLGLFFYLKRLKEKYYSKAHIIPNKENDKSLNRGIKAVPLFLGFLIAWTTAQSIWLTLQMYINAVSVDLTDPIFNMSIDFYLFKLPLYQQLLNLGIFITLVIIALTAGFTYLMLSIRPPVEGSTYDKNGYYDESNITFVFSILRKELFASAVRKVAFLGMFILLFIGAKYFLRAFELMYSTKGVAYGASYTDINVTLIAYRVLMVLSLISAIAFVIGLLKQKFKIAAAGPALMVVVALIFGLVGAGVQQLVVEPDEINKEKEYLVYNIEHTQRAFAVDNIPFSEFPVEQNLDQQDLMNNAATVENIRINDARPLKQTYNQIQGIRLYYEYNDIDVDRYTINGNYTQVFLSPRELNQANLAEQAKTWVNLHLKFTHGYGIVMSPVNEVTSDGQPKLIFKNVPPITDTDLIINRPEIYFGELARRYVIVNTEEPEFDYPFGSDNVTSRYEGEAGIELGGLNKLLFAYRERSLKLLVSTIVNSDSRIILYRNIQDRVQRIAPFLDYDQNPYLVINQKDGRLYWIIDAYTTSMKYPYSQPISAFNKNINYIRNSVKVVIDAYDGTTKFYIFDETDPIVQTYDKIFTDLFSPKEELTDGLMEHIRYPQDYFDIQSEVYRAYHVDNPVVFYNGEDIWDIANEKYMDGIQRIESNYVMFELADSESKEFALIIPYTPKEKPNMTSLLVARNDGDKYGQLYLYKFPKDKTIQGPSMIESRIDQDSTISPQFTLWGQQGSAVLRGNLIVVPIEESLIYVEPIYLRADSPNSLPEMKRVIVAYQDKIVMEETLELALERIFGEIQVEDPDDDTPPVIPSDLDIQEIIDEINRLLEENQENMNEIDDLLDQIIETEE